MTTIDDIMTWSAEEIANFALANGADPASRIIGVYIEAGALSTKFGFGIGGEGVVFVGVDTLSPNRDKVTAYYGGLTAGVSASKPYGVGIGGGVFGFTGGPEDFDGFSVGLQMYAGTSAGVSTNIDGSGTLATSGALSSIGANFSAGGVFRVLVNDQVIYNWGPVFKTTFSGFEFNDAYKILTHPDFNAGESIEVQVRMEDDGVIVTHHYQKVVDNGNGTIVNYSASVTDLDGNPVSDEVAKEYVDQGIEKYTLGRNDFCFAAGTPVEMADGTYKNIEDIKLGDRVAAFDGNADAGRGTKAGRRVTQLHRNENKSLINFHGVQVTPGHVFLTGDGEFKPVIEILEEDGTVVNADGVEVRARTGWPVGSTEDRAIPVGYPAGTDGDVTLCMMRAGTLYGGKNGRAYTIAQMMESRGYHLMADGRFVNVDGDIKTAYWEWGAPDDKMIAGQYASYADLVEGSEISMDLPLAPSRPN